MSSPTPSLDAIREPLLPSSPASSHDSSKETATAEPKGVASREDLLVDLPTGLGWLTSVRRYGWDEVVVQLKLAMPIMVGYIIMQGYAITSIIAIGRLDDGKYSSAAYNASANLGITYSNVFGLSIAIGFASALDTKFSQAYTRALSANLKPSTELIPILQRFVLIVLAGFLPLSLLFVFSQQILLACRQTETEALLASRWIWVMIFGSPPFYIFACLRKYIQTQNLTLPVTYIFAAVFPIQLALTYLLVYGLGPLPGLGYLGAPLAVSLTNYCLLFMACWTIKRLDLGEPWYGWDRSVWTGWGELISLGAPGVVMMCAEWWAFEICAFVAGYLGEVELAAQGNMIQITNVIYSVPLGLAISVSIRVGNLIGGSAPNKARLATHISLLLALAFGLLDFVLLISLRYRLGAVFSADKEVVEMFARVVLPAALTTVNDVANNVSSGILRGCGRQSLGAKMNLIAYYLLALPVALLLCLYFNLGIPGLWWGLLFGLSLNAMAYIVVVLRTDWEGEVEKSKEAARAGKRGKSVEEGEESLEMERTGR